jgi:hypothetical protein
MKLHQCPQCQGRLTVVAKKCGDCGLELRSEFDEGPFARLSPAEQDFLHQFILASGNFKALGERLDLTYPTLRGRLDRIIAKLEPPTGASPDEILDAVERGIVSPDGAIARLEKMTGKEEPA